MKESEDMMLEKHFLLAGEGKHCWERIEKKYDADLYILFPHHNDSYNYYALLHMERFIKSKRAERVLLIVSEPVIEKAAPLFMQTVPEILQITEHEMDAILKYYALYEFTSRLTIISLTRPYDTCGENLIGVKGVTKEDLLCFDIYRFSETPVMTPPVYEGSDREIISFLELTQCEQRAERKY